MNRKNIPVATPVHTWAKIICAMNGKSLRDLTEEALLSYVKQLKCQGWDVDVGLDAQMAVDDYVESLQTNATTELPPDESVKIPQSTVALLEVIRQGTDPEQFVDGLIRGYGRSLLSDEQWLEIMS